MICSKFSELSPLEKVMFIGELTHACMNENTSFEEGLKLIAKAKENGVFDNVKIMPENENTDEEI